MNGTDVVLVGAFLVWAFIAARLGYKGAEKQVRRQDAALKAAAAKADEQDKVIDQMADALSRLLTTVIPVVPVTDDVDGAVTAGLAALDGYGYGGRLATCQAALEEAETELDRFHRALRALYSAVDDPATGTLKPAMAEAAAALAHAPAAWAIQ